MNLIMTFFLLVLYLGADVAMLALLVHYPFDDQTNRLLAAAGLKETSLTYVGTQDLGGTAIVTYSPNLLGFAWYVALLTLLHALGAALLG